MSRTLAQGPAVLIIGAGGLGCPLALALGLAGGARLVIVDDDVVDLANLHRQILFATADVGRKKVEVVREALAARGFAAVKAIDARWDADSAAALAAGCDLLVDCTDSPVSKFITSDLAMASGRPAVIAAAIRDEGNVFASVPGSGRACYRCFFESPPDDADVCAIAGVLGPRCGEVAALAARVVQDLLHGRDPGAALFICGGRTLSPLPRAGCPAGHNAPGARMPIVRIPTPLRKLTLGKEEVSAAGATVGALIEDLERQFPGLKDRLCDDKGQVRRFVNIFQNDEDIRFLKQLETPIKDSDEISIVPAIAGGR
jgi:adenylyltransferase/sulfurtransferase